MNREANHEGHFDASDASKESTTEQMTRFAPISPAQPGPFFDTISTAC